MSPDLGVGGGWMLRGVIRRRGRRGAGALLAGVLGVGLLGVGLLGAAPAGAPVLTGRVSAGLFHTCAALPGGAVKCWGLNQSGYLGSGSNSALFRRPVSVVGISGVTQVAAGDSHTCALLKAGTVTCWGINAEGEVGNGTTKIEKEPVGVSGLSGVTQISAGGNHTCALLKAGTVKCWGQNNDGVLGNGSTSGTAKRPVAVKGLSGVASISVNGNDACALLKASTVKCWGENAHGQLGGAVKSGPQFCEYASFSYACSTAPVTVRGLSGVAQVAAGDSHICVRMKGRATVRCWGGNSDGQLGNGSTATSRTPVTVAGLSGVTAIASGGKDGDDSCALLNTGTVKCWGYNHDGQLGNGTTTNAKKPVSVSGLSGVTAITTDGNHSCAWLASNTAKCWGDNVHGQLGNGTTTSAKKPVSVVRL